MIYDEESSAAKSTEKIFRYVKHYTLTRLRHPKLYILSSLESLQTCLIVAMYRTLGRYRLTGHRCKPLMFPGTLISTQFP